MADSGKRAGPTLLTGSSAIIYTVPSATTAMIRTIHICNESASDATLTLSIGADSAGNRLYKSTNIPANGIVTRECSINMVATEVIRAHSGTPSALTLTIGLVEST